jgi:hypothetical protein
VHALRRRHWALLAPHQLDQAIGRDDLVRVDQQHREHRAQLALGQRNGTVSARDLEGPEDPEIELPDHPS